MTCYQRHFGWLFEAIGVPYDKEHRHEVHRAIASLVGLPEVAHCPEVWAALKAAYRLDTHTPSAKLAADVAAFLDRPE